MGDRLATVDMGRKVGAAVALSVEELGPHLTQITHNITTEKQHEKGSFGSRLKLMIIANVRNVWAST